MLTVVTDENGRTPIMQAIIHGNVPILELLKTRYSLDLTGTAHASTRSPDGAAALSLAIKHGSIGSIVWLVANGVEANAQHYHAAATIKPDSAAVGVITSLGASKCASLHDVAGRLPVHKAMAAGNLQAAAALVTVTGDSATVVDPMTGCCALETAYELRDCSRTATPTPTATLASASALHSASASASMMTPTGMSASPLAPGWESASASAPASAPAELVHLSQLLTALESKCSAAELDANQKRHHARRPPQKTGAGLHPSGRVGEHSVSASVAGCPTDGMTQIAGGGSSRTTTVVSGPDAVGGETVLTGHYVGAGLASHSMELHDAPVAAVGGAGGAAFIAHAATTT